MCGWVLKIEDLQFVVIRCSHRHSWVCITQQHGIGQVHYWPWSTTKLGAWTPREVAFWMHVLDSKPAVGHTTTALPWKVRWSCANWDQPLDGGLCLQTCYLERRECCTAVLKGSFVLVGVSLLVFRNEVMGKLWNTVHDAPTNWV